MVQEIISGFIRGAINIVNPKERKKKLRDLRSQPGIYCIENIINHKKYIGQSKNMSYRLSSHLSQLNHNHHTYKDGQLTLLQKAWNKYGKENFKIYILSYCDREELDEKEIFWIKKLKTNKAIGEQGYNMTAGGQGTKTLKATKNKRIMNNGSIQKFVENKDVKYYESIGFQFGLLPQNIEKSTNNRPRKYGKDNPLYGRKQPLEERIRRGKKIKLFYEQRKNTQEYKEKQRQIQQNKIKRQEKKIIYMCDLNNNIICEYPNLVSAATQNNIPLSTLERWVNQQTVQRDKHIWRRKRDS